MTDNRKAMRSMLEPLCNKVPASLSAASVNVVREWKKVAVKARKALDNNRATYEQLQTLFNQLSQYK